MKLAIKKMDLNDDIKGIQMLLKEKIEKFKNKKINIEDVLLDNLGNCIYSINNNNDELKELFYASNFNERIYIFKDIFCYNFEKNKNSQPNKIKDILCLFTENNYFEKTVNELRSIKKEIILNILPLLSEDNLKKNINWLWKDINILEINSPDIRKIYFKEYEQKNSGKNITDSVFLYILNDEEKIDYQILKNIIKTIELINANTEGFIEQAKIIYPNSYKEEIMNLLNLDIEEKVKEEEIKEYANFIIKNIKYKQLDLEEIIIPEEDLSNINPFIFECIIEELVNNKNKNAISKLLSMYTDKPILNTELNKKNKNFLFEKKASLEKIELLDKLNKSNSKKEIKKRL